MPPLFPYYRISGKTLYFFEKTKNHATRPASSRLPLK